MPGATFLKGDRVSLRTVETDDVEFLRDAINNAAVWRFTGHSRPLNREQEAEFVEGLSEREDSVTLLICVDGDAVGTVGLNGIDLENGHASVGYWVDPDAQNNGYATAATRLLVGYAFDQLRLNRIGATVFSHNPASMRVLEKAGFTEEGVLRETHFVDGAYRDSHRFGLLAAEWRDTHADA